MHLPERQAVEQCNLFIVLVVNRGFLERQVAGDQDEDDDSKSKEIGHSGLVLAFKEDFWRHIAQCSDLFPFGTEAISLVSTKRA